MSAQEALTFLFNAIALSFITIATIDLGREIIALYKQVFVAATQPPSTNSQPQALVQLPEEWVSPLEETAEASSSADQGIQEHSLPVLLLAQAKVVGEAKSQRQDEMTLEELLVGVNLDALKLRPARRIAKALGIAQKINGKDQKLDWLKGQIQAKLQQETSLLPEAIAVARGEVITC